MALTEPAPVMMPLEYLAAADCALADGKGQEAAGLLYQAAEATFLKLAQLKGLDIEPPDLVEVARSLEADSSLPKLAYRSNLIAASLLRDHAELDVLEAPELESAYGVVRKFILRCQSAFPWAE